VVTPSKKNDSKFLPLKNRKRDFHFNEFSEATRIYVLYIVSMILRVDAGATNADNDPPSNDGAIRSTRGIFPPARRFRPDGNI
jgi:hypothetical protein